MWKDNESNIDYIDFEYIANLVNEIVLEDDLLPASIGVYGDWGSGKSSIMSISQEKLRKRDKNALIINFNAWLFEDYGNTKNTVINCILDQIEKIIKSNEKVKDKFEHLRKSIDVFQIIKAGKDNILNIIPEIKNAYDEKVSHKSLRSNVINFRKDFGELIDNSGITRVVIYVDEMDRCLPDTILEIFEAMRLFLFTGKVAFVFGADERQISYAIRQKYSDSIFESEHRINIGKEYLEKIIQYPIRIPTMTIAETEMYLTLLFCSKFLSINDFKYLKDECIKRFRENTSKFELPQKASEYSKFNDILKCYSLSRKISNLLNSGLNGNPRQFKRFLNEFEIRKKVAKLKKINIDEKILVKMMILQYVKPNIFIDFINLYGEGSLDEYLKLYEVDTEKIDSKKKKIDVEKKWKDEWFEKWMKESPNIKEENLEPYFYLSRNTNNVFNYSLNIKISESARKIIDAYMDDKDIIIKKQSSNIENISIVECNQVIDELYNAFIRGSAKTNLNLIRGFVDIVRIKNECFDVVLNKLKLIPRDNISPAMLVYIKSLSKINENEIKKFIDNFDN